MAISLIHTAFSEDLPSFLTTHPLTFEEVVPSELEAQLAEQLLWADGRGPLPGVGGLRLRLGVRTEGVDGWQQGGRRQGGQTGEERQGAGRLGLHRLTGRLSDVRHHHCWVLLARSGARGRRDVMIHNCSNRT